MDDFNQGSENFAEEGLEGVKNAGQAAAHQAGRLAKRGISKATRGVRKAAGRAIKKVAAQAAKAITSAVTKLIAALGPIGIVAIAVLLIVALAFTYILEERGSVNSNVLDVDTENPTYMDPETGIITGIALTEPQAVVDAYYKYMSTGSYIKTYKDNIWEFMTPEQTEDFAALRDYNKMEENFYLSDDFIRQLDELLHNNDFFYPEQIIKPVYGQKLTLQDENGTDKKVYTSRLPYDTPDGDRMLDDEEVDGFADMLSPNNGDLKASGTPDNKIGRAHV